MAIKFVDGAEVEVGPLVVVIYGPPNMGKTSLALTAESPACLDFDGGVYRAGNKVGKAVLSVDTWGDVEDITQADLKPYKTLVVDTVGTCLDTLAADIITNNPKAGKSGSLTLQGYGTLKGRFKSWLDQIRRFGLDVVLVAHASEEQRGDETVDRIIATGSSKQEVYQQADLMGKLAARGENTRVLTFDPTSTSYGKNVGLEEYTVLEPEHNPQLLAQIISQARDLLDTRGRWQAEEHDRLVALRTTIEQFTTAIEFNNQMAEMIDVNAKVVDKKILHEVATAQSLSFDHAKGIYADPAQAPPSVSSTTEAPAAPKTPSRAPAAPEPDYDRRGYLRNRFSGFKTADEFTQERRMQIVTQMPVQEIALLAEHATAKGYTFDAASEQFVWHEQQPVQAGLT